MNTALLRRAPDCASDFTLDRWLLGELSRNGEARRLEEHLHHCSQCGSRVRSLRELYAHQRPPHRRAKVAPRVVAPPPAKPGQHGVAQVIILRDGLLVGTQVFTPGQWLLGSDPRCDLVLADSAVAPRHARLVFHAGKAAIADLGGGLFVNGFHVATAELRPIDELSVGPYVLRTRVIGDRWGEQETEQVARLRPIVPLGLAAQPTTGELEVTQPIHVPEPPAAPPVRVAPSGALQLELKLSWQDAVQVARVFTSGDVIAAERDDAKMPLWGFGLERASMRLASGDGQRFQVFVPTGATAERQTPRGWEAVRGPAVEVTAPVRIRRGAMQLLATVGPATARVAAAPVSKEGLGVAGASGALLVALLAAMHVFAPDDADFVPKDLPKAVVRWTVKPKVAEQVKRSARDPVVERSSDKPQRPKRDSKPRGKPPAVPKFAALDRFKSNSLDEISRALDKTAGKAGRRKQAGTQTLALPQGSGTAPSALGFSDRGIGGIGREGFKGAGQLSGGNLGTGKVGGQLERAVSRDVGGSATGIDKQKVAAVINQHLHEVQRCYERALLTTANLHGRVTLEWVISTSGAVKSVRTRGSSLKSPAVESCIIERLKTWPFPKAFGGDVTVSYPFVFDAVAF